MLCRASVPDSFQSVYLCEGLLYARNVVAQCSGCKFCLWVCPYGSPQFMMVKYIYATSYSYRLWVACPARAIHIGTTDEILALIGEKRPKEPAKKSRKEKML